MSLNNLSSVLTAISGVALIMLLSGCESSYIVQDETAVGGSDIAVSENLVEEELLDNVQNSQEDEVGPVGNSPSPSDQSPTDATEDAYCDSFRSNFDVSSLSIPVYYEENENFVGNSTFTATMEKNGLTEWWCLDNSFGLNELEFVNQEQGSEEFEYMRVATKEITSETSGEQVGFEIILYGNDNDVLKAYIDMSVMCLGAEPLPNGISEGDLPEYFFLNNARVSFDGYSPLASALGDSLKSIEGFTDKGFREFMEEYGIATDEPDELRDNILSLVDSSALLSDTIYIALDEYPSSSALDCVDEKFLLTFFEDAYSNVLFGEGDDSQHFLRVLQMVYDRMNNDSENFSRAGDIRVEINVPKAPDNAEGYWVVEALLDPHIGLNDHFFGTRCETIGIKVGFCAQPGIVEGKLEILQPGTAELLGSATANSMFSDGCALMEHPISTQIDRNYDLELRGKTEDSYYTFQQQWISDWDRELEDLNERVCGN